MESVCSLTVELSLGLNSSVSENTLCVFKILLTGEPLLKFLAWKLFVFSVAVAD
jgi:hypothetical protein